jgi:hypothetical protein
MLRLDDALARLVEQRVTDPSMPAAVYDRTRDGLLARRADLERGLVDLAEEAEALTVPVAGTARGLLAEWHTLPAPARRDLLAKLVREVRVVSPVDGGKATVEVIPRS